MPPRIEGLVWTEEAEEHIERHIHAWLVDELLEGGDFSVFANTRGHPPGRWKIIGRTASGSFVTAILEEPSNGDPTQWRPITAWRSEEYERQRYEWERTRIRRKQGGKHG
jgi:hypothetical protein